MTQQTWDLYTITIEEIVEHLKEHHSVPFDSRMSLSINEFIEEHFPEVLKDLQEESFEFEGAPTKKKTGHYLSDEGRVRLRKARSLLREALKYCEENSIAIAKVLDEVKSKEGLRKWEWRVCKPTHEQVSFMKFTRWFASAEGYFNKAVSQEGMLEELSDEHIELLIQQLRNTIKIRRKEREKEKEKKKEKIEIVVEKEKDSEKDEG